MKGINMEKIDIDNVIRKSVLSLAEEDAYTKGFSDGRESVLEIMMRIVDDADKKSGDKTYIVLDDGSFYSQAKYIKEKMVELLKEENDAK